MVFFRIKKIKGIEYCYIVENKWAKNGSRQKVRKYIGRIYKFELKNTIDFKSFLNIENIEDYVNNNGKDKVINDLIEWELFKHDIKKSEFTIDPANKKIQKGNRNIVLHLNDGFMCYVTLKNLLEYKQEGDEQIEGYGLAKCFVEAGIKVPQEVFVAIFTAYRTS